MSQALVVHVNRDDHHTLEPAAERFEAGGPFLLRLENHGAGCHLHLTFRGDLVPGRSLEDDNPYLEAGGTFELPVEVSGDLRPASGSVEVVTGYGQAAVSVDVEVTEDAATSSTPVAAGRETVPEDAGPTPAPSPAGDSSGAGGSSTRPGLPTAGAVRAATPELTAATVLLAVLAVLALVTAAIALRTLDGVAVTAGVLAVLGTVFGAGIYLLAE